MAVPVDTRRKILAALERGEAAASIALRFEIGERTVYRLQARHRTNLPVEPGKTGPLGPTKLTPDDEKLLLEAVRDRPGITAAEMAEKLSTKVAPSTICRAWNRLGLTRKKSRCMRPNKPEPM